MEAKLKSQRVADLRELLQKASVPIPAKANKADLIAKILASPAAIEAFNNPGSSITTTAATPKPKATESSQGGQDDDLLAPPEEFDWGPASNGAQPTSATPETNAPKADSKPAAAKPAAETKESGTEQPTAKPAAPPTGNGTSVVSPDEELEKRKKRAARFNIPLVEAKPLKATPASNGTKASKGAAAADVSAEDAAKVESRAARFGIPKSANNPTNVTTDTTAATGRKRARSPAPVDNEEMEKRKKRAERFAGGGEVKAQT